MADPDVSVLIPVSEWTHRLPEAVASVLGQTHKAVELILVIDPALFETAMFDSAVMDGFRHHAARLRHFIADADASGGSLLQSGAREAHGRFLAWLAPDTVWDPRKIELQLEALAGLPREGVATCHSRLSGTPARPAVLSGSMEDPESIRYALWKGVLDPRTILVPRSCFDAAGGFDPAYAWMSELDLAVRLAGKFPFTEVASTLVRHRYPPNRPADPPESSAERLRIWQGVVEPELARADTLATLAGRVRAPGPHDGVLPPGVRHIVQQRAANLITKADIAVVLVPGPDDGQADCAIVMNHLGLPAGECAVLDDAGYESSKRITQALVRTTADRIVLADLAALPAPGFLSLQLLHAVAEDLDACLPVADNPLISGTEHPDSLLTGTLFRRSALVSAVNILAEGEPQFWTAFSRTGRIGALPAAGDTTLLSGASSAPTPPALTGHKLPASNLILSLIDRDWYLSVNPDIAMAGIDPVGHYLEYGWQELRDPNPWFNTRWYLEQNPKATRLGTSALEHFVEIGAPAGRRPSPNFDLRWYSRHFTDEPSPSAQALAHFLSSGLPAGAVPDPRLDREEVRSQLRAADPPGRIELLRALQSELVSGQEMLVSLIDRNWYLSENPDIANSGIDPAAHYLEHGWREERDPNPWFHGRWYVAQNFAGARTRTNPLEHFAEEGASEGLRPSPGFDIVWYSKQYLHADSPSAEALRHFVTTGFRHGAVPDPRLERPHIQSALLASRSDERRSLMRRLLAPLEEEKNLLDALSGPNPWFDSRWYSEQNPDVSGEGSSPLEHFVFFGAARGRRPHPNFDIVWYASHHLGGAEPGAEALRHFLTIGLATGAVPDLRIAGEAVRKRLLEAPVSERTALIRRLLRLLPTGSEGQILEAADADLWPLLLTRNFPPHVTAVLLLCRTGLEASQAEAAARVLAREEHPVFGLMEEEDVVRITDQIDAPGVSVELTMPGQQETLKTLLAALPCSRAALMGPLPHETAIIRAVRNASVPVFTKEPALI